MFSDFASFDAGARLFEARLTIGGLDVPYFVGPATSSTVPATLVDPAALDNCFMPVFSSTVKQDDPPENLKPLLDAFAGSDVSAYAGAIAYDTVLLVALAIERSGGDTSSEAMADALVSEPTPAGCLTAHPNGTTFTDDNHFPTVPEGTMVGVPCTATIADGLWVTG